MPRIALGPCSCESQDKMKGASKIACEQISARLDSLKKLSFAELSAFPASESRMDRMDGFDLHATTYVAHEDNALLVVAQIFHRTWKWPTYFGLHGIGKMFAEGFMLSEEGGVYKAPDELLWEYR